MYYVYQENYMFICFVPGVNQDNTRQEKILRKMLKRDILKF